MSNMLALFILIGVFATVLFIAGYVIGIRQSLKDAAIDDEGTDSAEDEAGNYSISIALAVLASAVLIALAGINPVFMYAGPLLAIITAAMVGYAFFFEQKMRKKM